MITVTVLTKRNPEFREYEVNERVSNSDRLFNDISSEHSKESLIWIGNNGKSIVEDLFSTGGIGDILIFSEKISIQKKKEADWSKIEEQLMATLAKLYGGSKLSFWTWLSREINALTS
ncbi:MAG: NifU N-terminal domain-containing protein [Candidatus Paceibacterota bacterium]|jgi:hypothetical protein